MKQNPTSKFARIQSRRIYALLALFVLPFLANERMSAQNATGYLFQTGTGATTLNIDRSTTGTFQLDFNVMVPFSSNGVQYFLETGANGSGRFSVIARNTMGTPYTDIITSDGVAFTPANGLLDPVNNNNLGGTSPDLAMPEPPGQYFIARLTFSIRSDIPVGTYTIFLNRALMTDPSFNDHALVANTVTINIVGVPPQLALVSALSRKVHGTAGTFDIALPLAGEAGVECRNTGGDHTLVFTFNNNVVSGSATVTTGIGSVAGNPTFSGRTMTVELTGVADVQKLAVTLHNVTDSFAQVLPDTSVGVNMLISDASGNRAVNSADINRVQAQAGSPVTAANFRTDINASGSVTAADIAQVKTRSGNILP